MCLLWAATTRDPDRSRQENVSRFRPRWVTKADAVVWSYVTNTQPGSNLNPAPSQAVRLRGGDTLIADQFNDRVIQVTRAKNIRSSYGALNLPGKAAGLLNAPYSAKVIGDFTGLTPPRF